MRRSVSPSEYHQYINRFYGDPTYQFGLYSLLALRNQMAPEYMSRKIGRAIYADYYEKWGVKKDVSDVQATPLLRLLCSSCPENLTFDQVMFNLNIGFTAYSLEYNYIASNKHISTKLFYDNFLKSSYPPKFNNYFIEEMILHFYYNKDTFTLREYIGIFSRLNEDQGRPRFNEVYQMLSRIINHASVSETKDFINEYATYDDRGNLITRESDAIDNLVEHAVKVLEFKESFNLPLSNQRLFKSDHASAIEGQHDARNKTRAIENSAIFKK